MKKWLSLLLALVLIGSLTVPAFASLGNKETSTLPTVYLMGQGFTLYADKNNTKSETIHDIDVPDGYIGDVAKSLIKPLFKGLATNDWDEWLDTFISAVEPLFEKQALDENGEASNGSGVVFSSGRSNKRRADGTYALNAYTPNYDWRLDPYAVADDLHTYIGQVLAATKEKKVNLMGRSIGSSVVMAYLEKYGAQELDNIVLYCPSFYGMEVLSRAFAGKVDIDPAAVNRFVNYYAASGEMDDLTDEMDGDMMQVVLDIVSLSVSTHALDLPAGALQRIYEQVYGKLYPRLLVRMYGSMPSFWSLVGDDDYEEAKALIFGGQEETYARLIEKIDRFHYGNLVRSEEILQGLIDDGAKVQIVAKYGVPMVPVIEDADMDGDMLTSVRSATLGATAAPITGSLSKDYISGAKEKGTDKYLSPDGHIDASTGILPDHTWFIKNLAHRSMPESVNPVFGEMLSFDGYLSVFDLEELPQYLEYDLKTGTLSELTEDSDSISDAWKPDFLMRLVNVLRYIFQKIADFLKNMDFSNLRRP